MAKDLQTSWLVDVAKVVTTLGSGWVVYPLGGLAAIVLAVRRHWMEFWALVVGLALIAFFVPEIKTWTDRPRPPDPLDLGARLRLPERPRRPVDALHLAGDHARAEGCSGHQAAKRW